MPVHAQQAQGLVLEVVFFQSKPEVSSQQLLAAAEKVNPVLNSMPGVISRSVGHGQGHQWVEVVYWQSMSDAVHAAQRITSVPVMQNFEGLMIHHTV